MDLSNKTNDDISVLVANTDSRDDLREVASHYGITYSGNTGIDTLRTKIQTHLEELNEASENEEEGPDENDPVMQALKKFKNEPKPKKSAVQIPPISELLTMNPRDPNHPEALKRAIVRAKALRLVRCRINNMDPADAQVPGAIISVYTKYTGKVSKYIPFGEENEAGYHIPQILFDELNSRQYPMRKEIKSAGSSFGVKQYKTTMQKKFALEILPPLTKEELEALAQDQKARGAIDHSQ